MNDNVKNKKNQSWVIFGLIIVNIIFLIFVSNFLYLRLDLTRGQKYSISKPTKDLIKKIDTGVIIEYYYNDKAKQVRNMSLVIQYVEDILKEMQGYSRGKISVIIRTLSYEKHMEEIAGLEEQGIRQFPLVQSDKSEIKQVLGFSGIIIKYKDKTETIPIVRQSEGLEFDIAIQIKNLINAEFGSKSVGIIAGLNGKSLDRDYRHIKHYIKSQFKNQVDIGTGMNIPEDISTLLVIGSEALTEYDLFQIDQFLMRGGNLMVAASGVKINFENQSYGGPMVLPSFGGLFEMLKSYGITINRDIVGDNESFNPIPSTKKGYLEMARYPIYINVKSMNINSDSKIVSDLPELNLLWASSINIDDSIKDKVTTLFTTTKQSWADTQDIKITPEDYAFHRLEGNEQFSLAVHFQGELKSYFEGKEIPENSSGEKFEYKRLNSGTAQIVAVGNETFVDSYFYENRLVSDTELSFALNAVEALHTDSDLMKIRSKGMFERKLDKTTKPVLEIVKNIVIVFSTYILPILFIALGFILYILKRKKLSRIREQF